MRVNAMLTEVLLAILVLTQLALLVWCVRVTREARRAADQVRAVYDQVVGFFTPDSAGQSGWTQTAESLMKAAAGTIMASLKGTLLGLQSGAARSADALGLEEAAEGTPPGIAGLVANKGIAKFLKRNPILGSIGGLLLSQLKPGAGDSVASGGNGSRPKFDL